MFTKGDKNQESGFTLIELLVVIAIIGLLAAAAVVALNNSRMRSRDAKRLDDIKKIQTALEMYYDDHGAYPISSWLNSGDATWLNNSNTLAVALRPYLATLPIDPKNESGYAYNGVYAYSYFDSGYGGPGQWYMLVFRLENTSHDYQTKDGVKSCTTTNFHYGNNSNGIITIGGNCVIRNY